MHEKGKKGKTKIDKQGKQQQQQQQPQTFGGVIRYQQRRRGCWTRREFQ